jgi:hypothetical protein
MNEKQNDAYAELKTKLLEIGLSIPGTIHALYARCGSPTCPCATDNAKRHGPYYRWHYRIQGRTVTQGIEESQLPVFREWIANRERFYSIFDQMLEIGVRQATLRSEDQKSSNTNSKKASSRMRGK